MLEDPDWKWDEQTQRNLSEPSKSSFNINLLAAINCRKKMVGILD